MFNSSGVAKVTIAPLCVKTMDLCEKLNSQAHKKKVPSVIYLDKKILILYFLVKKVAFKVEGSWGYNSWELRSYCMVWASKCLPSYKVPFVYIYSIHQVLIDIQFLHSFKNPASLLVDIISSRGLEVKSEKKIVTDILCK